MNRLIHTLTLSVAATAALAVLPVYGGSSYDAVGTSSLESASDREITRRQEDAIIAQNLLQQGDSARDRKDVEAAYRSYSQAVDLIPPSPENRALRASAMSRFCETSVDYAEFLVSRGEYDEARKVAQRVLEPSFNPDYRPAIVFLSRLEEADYFNKSVTPEFAAKVDEVKKLLDEAVGLYDSGRFDKSASTYRRVLAVDPYNTSALRGLEQIEVAKQRYYEEAYNETRSRMLWQADKAWARPVPLGGQTATAAGQSTEGELDEAGTELMMEKLSSVQLEEVGPFLDANIATVVEWFKRKSRELGAGINITLESSADSAPITMHLKDPLPFYDALRYAATVGNMKVRVDPYVVAVVPKGAPTEKMIIRKFKVPPDFLSGNPGEAPAGEDGQQYPSDAYQERIGLRAMNSDAKAFLQGKGVDFPQGATASLAAGGTMLVVQNLPSNMEYIQAIVDAAAREQPVQVEIDAKFVEISQKNLKELGFDWTLGPFSIGGSGVFGGGGSSTESGRTFPFVNPATGLPVGGETATGGLRTGSGSLPYSAISINSLNAILAGQQLGAIGGPAPGILSLAGVFTNPQFQVLIRALNQKKGVDLMAAPKVTAKSGQRAKINITRDIYYPTEYEPPQIPQSTGGNSSVTVGELIDNTDPIITPSFPTAFEVRPVGVILEVEPQVGADGQTIDLSLSPEVTDFEGFINYGSPIYIPPRVIGGLVVGPRELATTNVINQPIFSARKVTTNVTLWDGQTVALGGLIREDIQKVNDKVPILGDIPLAGALFRSQVEEKIKRNLIIFVTARLIDANGQPLKPEEAEDPDETVVPLGLPPEITPPARANPKGGLTRK